VWMVHTFCRVASIPLTHLTRLLPSFNPHTVSAGENKSAHTNTGANLRKLEEETEDFHGTSRSGGREGGREEKEDSSGSIEGKEGRSEEWRERSLIAALIVANQCM